MNCPRCGIDPTPQFIGLTHYTPCGQMRGEMSTKAREKLGCPMIKWQDRFIKEKKDDGESAHEEKTSQD